MATDPDHYTQAAARAHDAAVCYDAGQDKEGDQHARLAQVHATLASLPEVDRTDSPDYVFTHLDDELGERWDDADRTYFWTRWTRRAIAYLIPLVIAFVAWTYHSAGLAGDLALYFTLFFGIALVWQARSAVRFIRKSRRRKA